MSAKGATPRPVDHCIIIILLLNTEAGGRPYANYACMHKFRTIILLYCTTFNYYNFYKAPLFELFSAQDHSGRNKF